MRNEHLFTLESDNGQAASVYEIGQHSELIFWGRIGTAVFKIGNNEDLEDFIDLLNEIKTQAEEEKKHMEHDHAFIEDAFIADEEGWIQLPGGAGKVSPEGIVYDKDGVEMYSLHTDKDLPNAYTVTYYQEDLDDYEWI
jgi:hypothetical protein